MDIGVISFSKLKRYNDCPIAYKYQYKERLKVPQLGIMFFGECLHRFIPRFWDKKTGKIYYKSPKSFAEAGIAYYNQWASGKLKTRKREIRFRNQWDFKNFREWTESILVDFYLKNRNFPKPIEMESPYNFKWRDFELTARFDRVDEHKVDGKVIRVVIDYKLGPPDEQKLKLNTSQFTMYSLAYENKYGERVPILWYALHPGILFPTQWNEEDYENLYKKLMKFKEDIENDVFPDPNFDKAPCTVCEFDIICAQRYPNTWRRRKERGEIEKQLDLFLEKPIIDIDPNIWVDRLYGSYFVPEKIIERPIGPNNYIVYGKNLEEARKALSLSAFSYWSEGVKIVEESYDYILLESKGRMPQNLRERLQKKGLEVYRKIRETETIIERGYDI
jgi:hypothetical protein